jgi:hypothetical protein
MSTMDGAPRTRRRELGWSGVMLALPLLAALPVFTLWGIVLFAVGGDAAVGPVRGWSELLIWQVPLGLWLVALAAVIVLAVRRRRTLRVAGIAAGLIAVCWAAGIVLPLVAR